MITRYLPTIMVLFGLFAFACAQIEEPCTDDGCPEFHEELTVPEPTEDIRGSLEYEKYIVPVVTTTSKDEFVYSLNSCITHLYQDVPIEKQIPRELIIAQAALETGWGKSMIYFIATKILRDPEYYRIHLNQDDVNPGPALLVSPLISLMRNQIFSGSNIISLDRLDSSQDYDDYEQI